MITISLLICLGTAIATLAMTVLGTLYRHRIESYTVQDSLRALQRITQAISELPGLPSNRRTRKRRVVAREILRDVEFVAYLVNACRSDPEIREQAWKILREIMQLNWELRKVLFLLRFRPKLVADCRRIFYAASGHCQVWMAYLRLLKAKYPELYGETSLP